jgi:peptide/nickel transport system substrate-binding protein
MKTVLRFLIPMVLLSLTAQAAPTKMTNEEFKIGISQEFETLNPMIMQMVASNYLYSMVGRSFVTMDTNGKWVPQLAKTIPSLENGLAKITTVAGKKTLTAVWEIQDKAQWGDGTPLTCADFQFSREVAENNNVSLGSKENYTMVAKIDFDPALPKKCTLTYDKPRWDFYQMPQFFPLPRHLEEPVYKKYGNEKEGYEKNSNYNKNPTLEGLYNGPYKVAEVKLGSHIAFAPNPKFWGEQPKIKKVIVKIIPNTATLEANLRSGTIDTVASLGFTFDQAISFEKKVKSEGLPYNVLFKPSLTYEHIDLNLDNPILKDVKVRKALVYALNRQELVQALFNGKQPAAIHNLATIDPWYTADPKKIVIYNYDKKKSGQLLDEAGWKLGPDGYRYKEGQKLSLQLITTAGNKVRETVQTFLQSQWKSVGVEIALKTEPARVFFGETMNKRKYSAMGMYAWVSSPESNQKPQFHSSNIPSEKNGFSGQNQPGWRNPKVDELTEKIEVEFDPKKRAELAQKILWHYTDDVPVIPLYYRSDIAVVPTALKNFALPGHQFSETNSIEGWTIQQ